MNTTENNGTVKKTGQPIAIRTWIYACFPTSSMTPKEWNVSYIIRSIVECAINHFKINMYIAGRKTRNHTTKADVLLACIASHLTVIVVYAMNRPQYLQRLKAFFTDLYVLSALYNKPFREKIHYLKVFIL